jgi:hypothetical protein
VLRDFFSTEDFSGSRSRDCNQNQEKGMKREDDSRMVRFFDGKLFSSSGCFPLSAMALGVFLEEEDERD